VITFRIWGPRKYKVRIVYKSGYNHDFWVYNFSSTLNSQKQKISWHSCSSKNDSLHIGIDEIESIWKVDQSVPLIAWDKSP